MTHHAGFKARIRARMRATGENFTQARSALQAERDEQLALGQAFRDKTLRSFAVGDLRLDGTLRSIPARRRQRVVILLELLHRFESDRRYSETEVNALLRSAHGDVAYLRRELIEYGFMCRAESIYWLSAERPRRWGSESQETAALEDEWFAGAEARSARSCALEDGEDSTGGPPQPLAGAQDDDAQSNSARDDHAPGPRTRPSKPVRFPPGPDLVERGHHHA
ncbi:DUF2087 domain-containing protein [Brevibacterium sp. BRM-1]|uniref:DUF2087 domain-containing protein n=1 Tax=Brevibacterium sp. BRM-1 TaxID=2999062 RepID=UPI00227F611E|nr:DUF2087 domain-containing protein [Brevibacterium sp. BRM-1]WAL40186.1 DUF2087 domain-containing protein [Brevibacterium sp. BRM-1]